MVVRVRARDDFERYFDEIMKVDKMLAAYLGDTSDRVTKVYFEGSAHYENKMNKICEKYKNSKDPVLQCIFKYKMQSNKLHLSFIPITSLTNPIAWYKLMNKEIYPKKWRKERDESFTKFIDCVIDDLNSGIKLGITMPKIICEQFIKDLLKQNDPWSIKLRKYLQKDYLKHCRTTLGLCALKNGKAMYTQLVQQFCTLDITPEEIHKIGLEKVEELSKIFKKVEHPIYAKSKDELLKVHYRGIYKNLMNTVIPKYFHDIPKTTCLIKMIAEKNQESSPGGLYYPRLRTFFVNLRDIKEHPLHKAHSLTMHETVPGHHYQFAILQEMKVHNARIHGFDNTALVEGWALYAETLTETMGSYDIESQMFRAVRLVVDTGIHYYNWSFDKAFEYMKKYLPSFQDAEIKTEILRYISMPGQAIAYMIGCIKIHELREEFLNKKLGDIKDFHRFFLEEGIVPFSVFDKKMSTYKKSH